MTTPRPKLPPAGLRNHTSARRDSATARAFPLSEPFEAPADDIAAIYSAIDFLNVEKSARYRPGAGRTYCNIYAHDLCRLLGVYLPRVWWTKAAIAKLAKGKLVASVYGSTVTELSANALHDWLLEHGAAFGWKRFASADELRRAVSVGVVGVICAQRRNRARSGHITCVVPDLDRGEAALELLQSQAGSKNRKFFRDSSWWSRLDTAKNADGAGPHFPSVVFFGHP
jgi:hypothetical protein